MLIPGAKRWTVRDTILFLERLELYITSGLSLDSALFICEACMPPGKKSLLESVRRHVESGGALWKGLKSHMHVDDTTAGLIEQGELSGQLERSLASGRLLLRRKEELKSKCLSAMAYPAVIASFAVVLIIGLVRGVVPQIMPMLTSLHVELPFLTKAVIFFSDVVSRYGLQASAAAVLVAVSLSWARRRVPALRHALQSLIIRIPIVGRLVRNYAMSVFLLSSGSLIESGLPVVKAYASSARSLSLLPLRNWLVKRSGLLAEGTPLSRMLEDGKFPPYVPQLLSAGEKSGKLGYTAERASAIMDSDMENSLKRLTSMVEPVMMAGMGVVVGAIALSIITPIYEISKVLER